MATQSPHPQHYKGYMLYRYSRGYIGGILGIIDYIIMGYILWL